MREIIPTFSLRTGMEVASVAAEKYMKFCKYLLALIAIAAFSSILKGESVPSPDILLIVNDSNPSAVTFTATSNGPLLSDSSHEFYDGVDLAQFFSNDVEGILGPVPSTLTTFSDKSPFYDGASTDDFSEGGTGSLGEVPGMDLSLFSDDSTGANPETFTFGTQAFLGILSLDLSPNPSVLPKAGYIGDIYAGYSGDLPSPDGTDDESVFSLAQDLGDLLPLLGQYEVIPEPSRWSMLLLGAGALFAARRFAVRKQA